MKHLVLACALVFATGGGAWAQSDFLALVDVNGDAQNTQGDRDVLIWWMFHGGDWNDLVSQLSISPETGLYDLSLFFDSDLALIDDPSGPVSGSGALGGAPCDQYGECWQFVRGDANADGLVNVADGYFIPSYLFSGGEAPCNLDSADTNDDGTINIGDAVYLLDHLFAGGAPPPAPFPNSGVDTTIDSIALSGCPDPVTLVAVAGQQVVAPIGTTITLTAEVLNAALQPVPSVPVSYEIVQGAGSLSASTFGPGQGQSSVDFTLGSEPFVHVVRASVAGIPSTYFYVTGNEQPAAAPLSIIELPFQTPLKLGVTAHESMTLQNDSGAAVVIQSIEFSADEDEAFDSETFSISFPGDPPAPPPVTLDAGAEYSFDLEGQSSRVGLHLLRIYFTVDAESYFYDLTFMVEDTPYVDLPLSTEFIGLAGEDTADVLAISCLEDSPTSLRIEDAVVPSGYSADLPEFPIEIAPGATWNLVLTSIGGEYTTESLDSLLSITMNTGRSQDGHPDVHSLSLRRSYLPGAQLSTPDLIVPGDTVGATLQADSFYAGNTFTIRATSPTIASLEDPPGVAITEISGIPNGASTSLVALSGGIARFEIYRESPEELLIGWHEIAIGVPTTVTRVYRDHVVGGPEWQPDSDVVELLSVPGGQQLALHTFPEGSFLRGSDIVEVEFQANSYGVFQVSTGEVHVISLDSGALLHGDPDDPLNSPIQIPGTAAPPLSHATPGLEPTVFVHDPTGSSPALWACAVNRAGEYVFFDVITGQVEGSGALPAAPGGGPVMAEDVDLLVHEDVSTGLPQTVFALTLQGNAYAISPSDFSFTSLGTVLLEEFGARLACDPVAAGEVVVFSGTAGRLVFASYDGTSWNTSVREPVFYDGGNPYWDRSIAEVDLKATPDGEYWVYQTWAGHAYVIDKDSNDLHVLEKPYQRESVVGVDPVIARYDPSSPSLPESRVILAYSDGTVRIHSLDSSVRWTYEASTSWTRNIDILVAPAPVGQLEERVVLRLTDKIRVVNLENGEVETQFSTASFGEPVEGVDPFLTDSGEYLVEILRRDFDGVVTVLVHGVAPSTFGALHELPLAGIVAPKPDVDLVPLSSANLFAVQDRRGQLLTCSIDGRLLEIVGTGRIGSSSILGVDALAVGVGDGSGTDEDWGDSSPAELSMPNDDGETDTPTDPPEDQDPPPDSVPPRVTTDSSYEDIPTFDTIPPGEDGPPGLYGSQELCLCIGERVVSTIASLCTLIDQGIFHEDPESPTLGAPVACVANVGGDLVIDAISPGTATIFMTIECTVTDPDTQQQYTESYNYLVDVQVLAPETLRASVAGFAPASPECYNDPYCAEILHECETAPTWQSYLEEQPGVPDAPLGTMQHQDWLLVPCGATVEIMGQSCPKQQTCSSKELFLHLGVPASGGTAVGTPCSVNLGGDLNANGEASWTPSASEAGQAFTLELHCDALMRPQWSPTSVCNPTPPPLAQTPGPVSIGRIYGWTLDFHSLLAPAQVTVGDPIDCLATLLRPTAITCFPASADPIRAKMNAQISEFEKQIEWSITCNNCQFGLPIFQDPEAKYTEALFYAFEPGTYTVTATWETCEVSMDVVVVAPPAVPVVADDQAPMHDPTVVGDPVYPHSGEFVETQLDLDVPGRGLNFNWFRRYKSRGRYKGPLGDGWDFSYNESLRFSGSDVYHYFLFHETHYTAGTGDLFVTPDGYSSRLRVIATGFYEMRQPNGDVHVFYGPSGDHPGKLRAIRDVANNTIQFTYDGSSKLTRITDTFGRDYTIEWSDDRITAVQDFAGRRVEYGYYEFAEREGHHGMLKSVTTPAVTGTPNPDSNDFPDGKTCYFTYLRNATHEELIGNLESIIRPNESAGVGAVSDMIPTVTITYGTNPSDVETFDRVLSVAAGGVNDSGVQAGGTYHYYYAHLEVPQPSLTDEVRWTIEVDRAGNVSSHHFNSNFKRLEFRRYTGRVPTEHRPPYPTAMRGQAVRSSSHPLAEYFESNYPGFNHELVPGTDRPGPDTNNAFIWKFEYDEHDSLIRETLPEGNAIVYEYAQANSDNVFARHNLTKKTWVCDLDRDPAVETPPADRSRSMKFEYEPWTNQVARVIEERGMDAKYSGPEVFEVKYLFDYQEIAEADLLADYLIPWGIASPGDALSDVDGLPEGFAVGLTAAETSGYGEGRAHGRIIKTTLPTAWVEEYDGPGQAQTAEVWQRHNDFGQIVQSIDEIGLATAYLYYPSNDPDGDGLREGTGSSTTGGYLESINRPESRTESLEYYPWGSIKRTVDATGVATEFVCNQRGQVVQKTIASAVDGTPPPEESLVAPLGYRTFYYYDHNDNLVRTQHENVGTGTAQQTPWFEAEAVYDILNRRIEERVESEPGVWLTTRYDRDPNENVVRITFPEGNFDERYYDERDLLDVAIRGASSPAEATFTRTTYDKNGNLQFILDGHDNDADGLPDSTELVYDGWDRLRTRIDPAGQSTEWLYDLAGNRVRTTVRGTTGGPTPRRADGLIVHPILAETAVTVDARNRRTISARFVGSDYPAGHETVEGTGVDGQDNIALWFVEYDARGLPVRQVNDLGHDQLFAYNGMRELIRVDSKKEPGTLDSSRSYRQYSRDRGGHAYRVRHVDLASDGTTETFDFYKLRDAIGRVVRTTRPDGQTNYFAYDSRSFASVTTDAMGPDLGSDPLGVVAGPSLNGPGNTTRFVRDGIGRLLEKHQDLRPGGFRTDVEDFFNVAHDPTTAPGLLELTPGVPDGVISEYLTHDGNSRLESIVDDGGRVISYGYDDLDRLVFTATDMLPPWIFHYDRDHNRNVLVDPRGVSRVESHDSLNRMIQVDVDLSGQTPGGVTAVTGTTQQIFEWDGLGRLTYAIDDNQTPSLDDQVVSFTYDGLSNPTSESLNDHQVYRQFDTHGNVLRVTYPDALVALHREFDSKDRCVDLSLGDGTPLCETQYIGFAGRRLEELHGTGNAATQYSYDSSRRLETIETSSLGTTVQGRSYTYDRNDNRVSERYLEQEVFPNHQGRSYQFDSAQRMRGTRSGVFSSGGVEQSVDPEFDWSLDGANNAITIDGPTATHSYSVGAANQLETRDGVSVYAHDASGNLTSDQNHLYEYDAFDRLVAVYSSAGVLEETYEYDALNRRTALRRWESGSEVSSLEFVYDGQHVIEERAGDGSISRNYHGTKIDRLVAREDTQGLRWLHADVIGSTVALTDTSGSPVERYQYTPYGAVTLLDGTFTPIPESDNPYLFQGRRLDDTGLYHFRARPFDPETGRFLQRDPIRDPVNEGNLYAFAGNNPIGYRDPYGESAATDALWDSIPGSWWDWGDSTRETIVEHGEPVYDEVQHQVCSYGVGLLEGFGLMSQPYTPCGERPPSAFARFVGMVAATVQLTVMTGGSGGATSGRGLVASSVDDVVTGGIGGMTVSTASATRGTITWTRVLTGGNCFAAGTMISTVAGLRAIETIEIGDWVWARDLETGENRKRQVTRLFRTPAQPVLTVEVANEDGSTETMEATYEHPFFVSGGGWTPANELKPGDRLSSLTGSDLAVVAIHSKPRRVTVYNFEVETDHCYFVGQAAVLVHNSSTDREITLFKAPQRGRDGLKEVTEGYDPAEYPGGGYFSESPSVSRGYQNAYENGMQEVHLSESDFNRMLDSGQIEIDGLEVDSFKVNDIEAFNEAIKKGTPNSYTPQGE